MAIKEQPNKTDTTRLRSRTQNICFLTSISAVVLKLMVPSHPFSVKGTSTYKIYCSKPFVTSKRPLKQSGQVYDAFVYTLPCC